MERPRGLVPEHESFDEFFRNPPLVILVFDNFTTASEEKSQLIMQARAALAAKMWHSDTYKTPQERPFIVSFAGIHENGDIAGSQKVAAILKDFQIPEEKIITRQTTITTTGDIRQLHSLLKESEMHITGPVAIVTTDGHAQRTKQEVRNHARVHKDFGPVYVLHPSHPVINHIMITKTLGTRIQKEIRQGIKNGKTPAVNHGLVEGVAWALSAIPPLHPFQHILEERSHPGMRQVESSRYVATGMKKAARKLRTLRRYAQILGLNPREIEGLFKKDYPNVDAAKKQVSPTKLWFAQIKSKL